MCSISLNKAGKIKMKSLKIAHSLCLGPPNSWCSNFSGRCSAPCSIWCWRKDLILKDVLWNEYWRTTQYLCDQVVLIFVFRLFTAPMWASFNCSEVQWSCWVLCRCSCGKAEFTSLDSQEVFHRGRISPWTLDVPIALGFQQERISLWYSSSVLQGW